MFSHSTIMIMKTRIWNFEVQKTVLKMLDNERSPEVIKSIREYIKSLKSTNIGISTLEN